MSKNYSYHNPKYMLAHQLNLYLKNLRRRHTRLSLRIKNCIKKVYLVYTECTWQYVH